MSAVRIKFCERLVQLNARLEKVHRFDARARNQQGEYAATDGGTITPNQAAAAYSQASAEPSQPAMIAKPRNPRQLMGQELLDHLLAPASTS